MLNEPRIGVVVPVYNRPQLVLQSLDTVSHQTMRPPRLVIVDDGSQDDTPVRVQQWLKTQPPGWAVLMRQSNQGISSARNHGAEQNADCDFLTFLDSDDLWPPDYLERMIPALASHPNAVAATCDRLEIDYRNNRRFLRRTGDIQKWPTQEIFLHCPAICSNTVIRSAAFNRDLIVC